MNFSKLKKEDQLLLYCGRKTPSPSALKQIKQITTKKLNWKYLVRQAINQGTTSMLYRHLSLTCRSQIPEATLNRLRTIYQNNLKQNLVLSSELQKLTSLLKSNSVPFISLKGPCLAEELYGDIAMRPSGDLDILIKPEQFEKTHKILNNNGYIPNTISNNHRHPFHDEYKHKDLEIILELHRGFNRQQYSFAFDCKLTWDHTRRFSLGKSIVPVLGRKDLFMYLCVHFDSICSPYGGFLKWLSDISELMTSFSEDELLDCLKLADHLGRQRFTALCLLLSFELLDAPLSAKMQMKIKSIPETMKLRDKFISNLFTNKGPYVQVHRLALNLAYREKWKHKLKFLLGYLEPDENDLATAPLPQYLNFMYYIIRPFRIIFKYRYRLIHLFR